MTSVCPHCDSEIAEAETVCGGCGARERRGATFGEAKTFAVIGAAVGGICGWIAYSASGDFGYVPGEALVGALVGFLGIWPMRWGAVRWVRPEEVHY